MSTKRKIISDYLVKVGNGIRDRRKELGITQKELAEKVGYTNRSTIARIEAGQIDIKQATITELAKALDITTSDLLLLEVSDDIPARTRQLALMYEYSTRLQQHWKQLGDEHLKKEKEIINKLREHPELMDPVCRFLGITEV